MPSLPNELDWASPERHTLIAQIRERLAALHADRAQLALADWCPRHAAA